MKISTKQINWSVLHYSLTPPASSANLFFSSSSFYFYSRSRSAAFSCNSFSNSNLSWMVTYDLLSFMKWGSTQMIYFFQFSPSSSVKGFARIFSWRMWSGSFLSSLMVLTWFSLRLRYWIEGRWGNGEINDLTLLFLKDNFLKKDKFSSPLMSVT